MKPIYPVSIEKKHILDSSWIIEEANASIILHIRNVCLNYPSLIMGFSADFDAKANAYAIANRLIEFGINVFLSEVPVPIAALSFAMTSRNMPIGLYIEEDEDQHDKIRITPISTHGGLFDEKDLGDSFVENTGKKGVVGSTDIIYGYTKHLGGFVDPFIESGVGFASLEIPFKELEEALKMSDKLKILFERDSAGPKVSISTNGAFINLDYNEENWPASKVALKLAKYLKEERYATGTIFGPIGQMDGFEKYGEVSEITGNDFDLVYNAGFADLLMGWWPDGLIALQGNSSFGDGILASVFFLESLRTTSQD